MKLLSAIAITAVCLGHINPIGFEGPFGLFTPYCYQVAAFVFISGYFYRPQNEQRPLAYLIRKFKRLIVPLLGINAAYGIVCLLLRRFAGIEYGAPLSLETLLVDPFASGQAFVLNNPMWFIAPLFFAETANIALRLPLRNRATGTAKEIALFALYLAAGIWAICQGGPEGIPAGAKLAACRTAFFLSCFGMGRLYRTVLERRDTLPNTIYFLIVIAVQLAVVYAGDGVYVYNTAAGRFYHGPALTYLATICGLAFMLRICKILGPTVGRLPAVKLLADCSFSVMCHHFFGYFLVTLGYAALAAALGIPADFDFSAFRSTATGYFFLPGGHVQFVAVYVIAGIAFSLCVHHAWIALKRRGRAGGLRLPKRPSKPQRAARRRSAGSPNQLPQTR